MRKEKIMSEDVTRDEYSDKPIMLKVFGKNRLIDLRSINKWLVYQKKEGNNYTLYSILLENGVCYKYKSVLRRGENEPTYSVILPSGEEIIFGKGEEGFKELETFGYVFLTN